MQSIPQHRSALTACDMVLDFMFERRKLLPDLHGNRTGYVAFIGKIQFSFNESPRIDKSLAPLTI
ncbi:Uncharacterised protein [Brucella suis]|nr:Uncharacterised protein [Brucella suis]